MFPCVLMHSLISFISEPNAAPSTMTKIVPSSFVLCSNCLMIFDFPPAEKQFTPFCLDISLKNSNPELEQRPNEEGTILVIVDGAAFGSEMKDISECIKTQGNIVLYAPESFEWLLLSTKEIPEVNVETVLQNPEEYIDSKEYVSCPADLLLPA